MGTVAREGSDVVRRATFPFDSLALQQQLEDAGIGRKQAISITQHVLDIACSSADSLRAELATRSELDQNRLKQEARYEQVRHDLNNGLSHHTTMLDRLRVELKFETEKLSNSQKLDLNLERGRMRDELQKQREEVQKLDAKIDREIRNVSTQIEASKNDLLRYSVGTLVSMGAFVLAAVRLMI
jgi:hypothetical protein